MIRKGENAVKGDPKKSWSGIEKKAGVEKEEARPEVSLMGIHSEERCLTFARIEWKTPILRPALQSKQSSLCGLYHNRDQGGGVPNGQIVSIKRAPNSRRQRSREVIDEVRKVRTQEQILAEHLDGLERNNFCDFEKPSKHTY